MRFDIRRSEDFASVHCEPGDDKEYCRQLMRNFLRYRIKSMTPKSDRVGLRTQFYIVAHVAVFSRLPADVRWVPREEK